MRSSLSKKASNPFFLSQNQQKSLAHNLQDQQKIDRLFSSSYTDFGFYQVQQHNELQRKAQEQEEKYNLKPSSGQDKKKIRFGPTSFTPSEPLSPERKGSSLLKKTTEDEEKSGDGSVDSDVFPKKRSKRLDVVAAHILHQSNVVLDQSDMPLHLKMLKKGEGKLMNCNQGENNLDIYDRLRDTM